VGKVEGIKAIFSTCSTHRAEDVFLCRSYVNCTVDSIIGTNQKKKDFYLAVCTKYNTLVEEAPVGAKSTLGL
jgi:hypothetical protein